MHGEKRNPRKLSAAATASYLSDNFVELNILPRLPAKALIRFQCVSKRWHRVISSRHPLFVHLQSHHAAPAIMQSQCFTRKLCLSVDPKAVGIPRFDKDIKQAISKSFSCPVIIASCNGLICCVKNDYYIEKIVIGNPALKDWKLLPVNPCCKNLPWRSIVFGLAVDVGESSVRYEFVMLIKMNGNCEYESHVFSSTTKQWSVSTERIKVPGPIYDNGVAMYVKGQMYWRLEYKYGVLWIDMENKLSGLQILPPDVGDFKNWHIGECGGKFSCAMINIREIQMWSLENHHWFKRFSINIESVLPSYHEMKLRTTRPRKEFSTVRMKPFASADFLLFLEDNITYCYDTRAGVFHKQNELPPNCLWIPYKNTLVSLPVEEEKERE